MFLKLYSDVSHTTLAASSVGLQPRASKSLASFFAKPDVQMNITLRSRWAARHPVPAGCGFGTGTFPMSRSALDVAGDELRKDGSKGEGAAHVRCPTEDTGSES